MLSYQELCTARCVRDLVHVVEEIEVRARARAPLPDDEETVGLLALWAILRWERTFLLKCLERIAVDMWGLTRDVDELLRARCVTPGAVPAEPAETLSSGPAAPAIAPRWPRRRGQELDSALRLWLSRARQEAWPSGHGYLGTEHLLLAILAEAHGPLAEVLARHGLDYVRVRAEIFAALAAPGSTEQALEATVIGPRPPPGAGWDTPAVGMPRRFGVGILLLLVTMFALLFAAMQLLGAGTAVFIVFAVFFAGVGLGQMFLFDGRYPRAASIWTGAVLLPVESFIALLVSNDPIFAVFLTLLAIPVGAGFGYLAGGLIAGAFWLLRWYAARKAAQEEAARQKAANDESGAESVAPLP